MAKLRTHTLFADARLVLIVVESVETRHGKARAGCYLYGKVEPIAVVVGRAEGIYALDMQARPADLEQLRAELPELDAQLAAVLGGAGDPIAGRVPVR